MSAKHCTSCDIPLMSQREWRELPKVARKEHRENRTFAERRGNFCGRCFQAFWRQKTGEKVKSVNDPSEFVYARTYPDDEIALKGGHWVVIRGVRRWKPHDKPTLNPRPLPTADDVEQQRLAPVKPLPITPKVTLCDCGCLIRVNEDCPACRAWARRAEKKWNYSMGMAA